MVQDAMPAGDYWIYDMASVLECDGTIAAVASMQIPRPDADLFARFSINNHYRVLDAQGDKVVSYHGRAEELSPMEKRKLTLFDDTGSLIRRSAFDRFRYKELRYGEDIELSQRLMENNYRIAFLYSVCTIHSHNRDPSYYLKRIYMDNKLLASMFMPGSVPDSQREPLDVIFSNIFTLYAAINASIGELGPSSFDLSPGLIIEEFRLCMQKNLKKCPAELSLYGRGNASLDGIFDRIRDVIGDVDLGQDHGLALRYFTALEEFRDYLMAYDTLKDRRDEFIDSMYKLFGLSAAYPLSRYCLSNPPESPTRQAMAAIDRILSEGV
jgi:hypothetical protein